MKYYVPAVLWAAVITYLSLTAASNLPEIDWDFLAPDKVGHFTVYAILSIALLWGRKQQRHVLPITYLVVTAFCAIYGILMEYSQLLLTNDRMFEYPDMVANILGAVLGAAVFRAIAYFIK